MKEKIEDSGIFFGDCLIKPSTPPRRHENTSEPVRYSPGANHISEGATIGYSNNKVAGLSNTESCTTTTQASTSPTCVNFDRDAFDDRVFESIFNVIPNGDHSLPSECRTDLDNKNFQASVPLSKNMNAAYSFIHNVATIPEEMEGEGAVDLQHHRSVTDVKDFEPGNAVEKPKRKSVRARVADLAPDQIHCCPYEGCAKKFAKKYNLKIHVRRHTGELPFVCGVRGCSKRFMWHSSFLRHQRSHERREKKRRGENKIQEQRKKDMLQSLPTGQSLTSLMPDNNAPVLFPFEHLANSHSCSSSMTIDSTAEPQQMKDFGGPEFSSQRDMPQKSSDMLERESPHWSLPPIEKRVLDDHFLQLEERKAATFADSANRRASNQENETTFGDFDLSALSGAVIFGLSQSF